MLEIIRGGYLNDQLRPIGMETWPLEQWELIIDEIVFATSTGVVSSPSVAFLGNILVRAVEVRTSYLNAMLNCEEPIVIAFPPA